MAGVYLMVHDQPVGFARILCQPDSSQPSTTLHGTSLERFQKENEQLIVVNSVQIYQEAFNIPYPYCFKSFDEIPTLLGDMNKMEFYKASIAWDKTKTRRKDRAEYLPSTPQIVSRVTNSSFRYTTPTGSPRKVLGKRNTDISPHKTNVSPIGKALVYAVKRRYSEAINNDENASNSTNRNNETALRFNPNGKRNLSVPNQHNQSSEDPDSTNIAERRKRLKPRAHLNPPSKQRRGRERTSEDMEGLELTKLDEIATSNSYLLALKDHSSDSIKFNVNEGIRKEQRSESEEDSHSIFEEEDYGAPEPNVRQYRYRNRKRGSNMAISAMRSARQAESQRKDNPFLVSRKCCAKLRCFDNVDPHYAFEQYKSILKLDSNELRMKLQSWLDTTTMQFYFNDSPVCYRFLCIGFKFSNYLMSSIKGTPKSRPPPGVLPRESTKMSKRNSISVFIRSYAEEVGDKMPNSSITTLPITEKTDLYQLYLAFYHKFHEQRIQEQPPTKSYFLRIWKQDARHVKSRKAHGFTKCSLCEKYRSELLDPSCNATRIQAIRVAKTKHLQFMRSERMGYYMRRDRAAASPRRYCSFIIDGADQKSYGLPHFTFSTKGDRGQKMKVKCVGVLEHGIERKISLFPMTEEFSTGSNHIIEALHRVLDKKYHEEGFLPPTIYIQLDNCSRENKNHYLLSYLESLVGLGVFNDVQASFLPVGHTHEDIDQVFSSLARHLRTTDAHTMTELIKEMKNTWKRESIVAEMKNMINYSDLCEYQKLLTRVQGISQFRYFRFTRATDNSPPFKTNCHVKRSLSDNWNPLRPGTYSGILKEIPNFMNAPPLQTNPPANRDQVLKCIDAAEERIKSQAKMKELRQLYRKVYTRSVHQLHWNTNSCFEFKARCSYNRRDDPEDEEHAADLDVINTDEDDDLDQDGFEYNSGSFVAVKACDSSPFWIGKVRKFFKKNNKIQVLWYEGFAVQGRDDPFNNSYKQLGHSTDTVSVETVHLNFDSLTRSGTMRCNVVKALRQVLGTG